MDGGLLEEHGRNARQDGAFEVVFVCTGNRARSPLAAALLRKYTSGLDTRIHSVGTTDVGALGPLPEALDHSRRLGVDLSEHRARPVGATRLDTADLVLGFEPFHLAAAVIDGGANAGRTFLLGELVALLEEPLAEARPFERARRAISAADARRVRSRPDARFAVTDPLGQQRGVVTRVMDEVDVLVRQLATRLFGIEPRQ